MKLPTADLRTDRHWHSATDLDQQRFHKLLTLLPTAYEQVYGQSIQQRQEECPRRTGFKHLRGLTTVHPILALRLPG
ncbi:hypothetical protein [Spirosoma gilvum]